MFETYFDSPMHSRFFGLRPSAAPPTYEELQSSKTEQPTKVETNFLANSLSWVRENVTAPLMPVIDTAVGCIGEGVKAGWEKDSPRTLALWERGNKWEAEGHQRLGDFARLVSLYLWLTKPKK